MDLCERMFYDWRDESTIGGFGMYVTIADFVREWNREASLTLKVLEGLTDESLERKVYPEGRTLGRIVWHFTTNIPEYLT